MKQVLSIEQILYLKELGLDTSDGSMCFEWNQSDSDNMVVTSLDADTNYDHSRKTTPYRTFSISCLVLLAKKC